MPFPKTKRVIYRHNPLEQVICQLRFPTVLRIEAERPASFQERIRDRYPVFNEPALLTGGPQLPEEVAKLVGSLLPVRPSRVYEFVSADGRWKLTLAKDFIALVCFRYEKWERFVEHLSAPLKALTSEYSPAFFERIGLRYRNIIKRSVLNLELVPWSALLTPHITAELGTKVADHVESATHEIVIRLDGDHGRVKIQHGLARTDVGEEVYVVDNDFFTPERTDIRDAAKRLNDFHAQSGRLFQWCIQPRLHEAMGPSAVR